MAAINSCVTKLGDKHFYYTVIRLDQAEMFREQSKYAEAEQALRTVLSVREETLPANHPNISEAKVKLARVLAEQGKYAEARGLANDALKSAEEEFGKSDQNLFVARAKNCLGNIYRQDGRYQDAENLLKEALASQRKAVWYGQFGRGCDNARPSACGRTKREFQRGRKTFENFSNNN